MQDKWSLNFESTTPVRAWVFNLILGGVIAVLVAGLLHMDIKDAGSFNNNYDPISGETD